MHKLLFSQVAPLLSAHLASPLALPAPSAYPVFLIVSKEQKMLENKYNGLKTLSLSILPCRLELLERKMISACL